MMHHHMVLCMFNCCFFIRPKSDHCLPLAVTVSDCQSLTPVDYIDVTLAEEDTQFYGLFGAKLVSSILKAQSLVKILKLNFIQDFDAEI